MRPALLLAAALLAAPLARAEPPRKAPAKKKAAMSVPSLGLSELAPLPKGDELRAAGAGSAAAPEVRRVDERFEVLGVEHAQGARRPLTEVGVSGSPPRTEPFSTRVRVRSAARRTAPIDVVVLDARGDTVMSASGTLSLSGLKGDVAEYTVDWDPSTCRGPGAYSVLVRVAGQPLGTWPLQVVARAP
jgi:hypothetical protein